MNTLKRIEKQLKKAQKQSTCDDVFLAYHWGRSCREELNNYTPKNNKEETKKGELLTLAENLIDWANYWSKRIA